MSCLLSQLLRDIEEGSVHRGLWRWILSLILDVDLQQLKKDLYLEKPPGFWKRMAPMWAIVKEQYIDYAKRDKRHTGTTNRTQI